MANTKELIVLCATPFNAGVEATVIPRSKWFWEGDISDIMIDDPWWGIIPLTQETYVAVTYAAYTAAAPPAWGQIMFNADRTAFKCGTPVWWGKVLANVVQVGSKVLIS